MGYSASAVNAQGDRRQCNTTDTSCTMAGLQCGTTYNFSVQASDGVCNSLRNPIVQRGIGKEDPQERTIHIHIHIHIHLLGSGANG